LGESAKLAGAIDPYPHRAIEPIPAIYQIGGLFGQFMRSGDLSDRAIYIVSGWMGTIKSPSIIPHSPTDRRPLPIPHHVPRATGIDIIRSGDRQNCIQETAQPCPECPLLTKYTLQAVSVGKRHGAVS